jgi:putative nucleotidyltransferase with HDIG domain
MNTIEVLQKLEKDTKAEVYLVGGFVRDFLLEKANSDLDTVVRNLSIKRISDFLKKHGKMKFVKLSKVENSFDVEVLLFKAHDDTMAAQIKLPTRGKTQISSYKNTLRQDCMHRDFTINALYLPINAKKKSEIIDFVGGVEDLNNKRIVAVGNAMGRIKEHPVRILRGIALAARTGFKLDEDVLFAMRYYTDRGMLSKVHIDNIRTNLNHIVLSHKPSKYLRLMHILGILKIVMPELDSCVGVTQDKRYHKWDVFHHCIFTCDNLDPELSLRLGGLLHDIGKPDTRAVSKNKGITFHKHEMAGVKLAKNLLVKLGYSNAIRKEVLKLVRLHMYHYTREYSDGAVRRFIRKAGITKKDIKNLSEFPLFKLRAAERLGNGFKTLPVTAKQMDFEKRIIKIFEEDSALRIGDLVVNGNDIMSVFKLEQSEKIGDIQNYLLEKVLDNKDLNNRIDLIRMAGNYLRSS